MARKKKSKAAEEQAAEEQATEDSKSSKETAEPAPQPAPAEAADDQTPLAPFDAEASERVLAACANLTSLSVTAIEEATTAAQPFLSFAQRTRIRALATNFDPSAGAVRVVREAPARSLSVVGGGDGTGPSRAEIDAIIEHRVQIAVTEALQRLGAAPGQTIAGQIDKTVQTQVSDQENRILDFVRTQLTDSLGVFETRLDERLADIKDAQSKTAVDSQVEEAREKLLKDIDEVRTVEVGADAFAFAAGIVEVDGTDEDAGDEVIIAGEDEVAIETEAVEVEVGDGVEVEIGDGIEIEDAEVEAVEVEAEPIEAEPIEVEVEEAEVEVEETEVEVEADSNEDTEIEVEPVEIEVGEIEQVEVDIEGDAPEELAADAIELGDLEDIEVAGEDEGVEIEVGDDASIELDSVDLETMEDLEEISVIHSIPGEAMEEVDVDLGEVELDEDLAGMTLGDGPDEIRVDEGEAKSDDDGDLESEIDIEIDIEEADEDGDDKEAAIARYMDRAVQMGARQQFTPALELYSKVLDLDDGHFDALVSRGVLYSKTKEYRKATDDFRKAQEISPERAGSYYGLAELHYNRRQFNKAIKNYNLALERDDQLAEAYCRRGLSYYYLKNYKVAFHDLYKAYDINPDLPKIRSFLKLVQNKIKESEG